MCHLIQSHIPGNLIQVRVGRSNDIGCQQESLARAATQKTGKLTNVTDGGTFGRTENWIMESRYM